uniref:Uncharacterized LOC107078034 n=1 Tax=Lepisosteus oculatus TaxID=7918 RepID=W5NH20_LEPOC|nr:PREDICTED: uncharacterized protein LOC107078034 isoform X1 [Lepisosteus oculatus]
MKSSIENNKKSFLTTEEYQHDGCSSVKENRFQHMSCEYQSTWFFIKTEPETTMDENEDRRSPFYIKEKNMELLHGRTANSFEHCYRKKRVKSPLRDTSPVPSHYSEPVFLRSYKGAMKATPQLCGVRDGEDDDDVMSLKSVQSMGSTLGFTAMVKRYRGLTRRQAAKHRLPSVSVEEDLQRSCLVVTGASCPRYCTLPPISKTSLAQRQGQEHSPSRGGIRPDIEQIHPPEGAATEKVEDQLPVNRDEQCGEGSGSRNGRGESLHPVPQARITFQSPVVQGVFPDTPAGSREEGKADEVKMLRHTKFTTSTITSSSLSSPSSRVANKSGGSSTGRYCAKPSKENNPAYPVNSAKLQPGQGNKLSDSVLEKSEILMIELGITFPKIESNLRCRNQKHPMKSALKKSFDWKAYSRKIRCSEAREQDGGTAETLSADNFHRDRGSLQTAASCARGLKNTCTASCREQELGLLFQKSCPLPQTNNLLEPFSGFRQYLQRQLLRSPEVYGTGQAPAGRADMAAGLPGPGGVPIQSYRSTAETQLLQPSPALDLLTSRGPLSQSQRTVELSSSHGGMLPKITMTCPTPSPKPPLQR